MRPGLPEHFKPHAVDADHRTGTTLLEDIMNALHTARPAGDTAGTSFRTRLFLTAAAQ